VIGGTTDCTVCYWDLESDDPEPVVLEHPDGVGNTPGARCSIFAIDHVLEHGDPLSGFVIAFVGCDSKCTCGLNSSETHRQLYQRIATPTESHASGFTYGTSCHKTTARLRRNV
jgi:hypothetical protein